MFFVPYLPAGEGQMREALRGAVATARDVPFLTPKELKELFPDG